MKITQHFIDKFNLFQTQDLQDCVLWTGKQNGQGYGNFCFEGCRWLAHRAAYWVAYGYTTKRIAHTCKNKLCINPSHLKVSQ